MKNNNFIENLKNKEKSDINKILFVSFDNKIGHVVIESLFFREIKKLNPDLMLDVIIFDPYQKLIENNPNINNVYVIDTVNRNIKWKQFFSFIGLSRKQKYDLVVDITGKQNLKRLLFMFFINPRKIMTTMPKSKLLEKLFYRFIKYKFAWNDDFHFSNIFVRALNLLGIKEVDTKYELFITREDKDFVKDFIAKNNLIDKKMLVFNPKAAISIRTLNNENIREILNFLKKYDYSVILLDYKKEYEEFKNSALLFTSDNIMQVAALIEQSDYVLTTDTGIVHISDVFLKCMTVLYGDFIAEGPLQNKKYVDEWSSVNPKTGKIVGGYDVNEIDLDKVFAVLDEELNNSNV